LGRVWLDTEVIHVRRKIDAGSAKNDTIPKATIPELVLGRNLGKNLGAKQRGGETFNKKKAVVNLRKKVKP